MDNKTYIEIYIVAYKPIIACLLEENVSSLINFVALPEDVKAAIFFLHKYFFYPF